MVQAFVDCGAQNAIGCHWGTFQLTDEAIDAPVTELAASLKAKGIAPQRFQAFRPGQVWQGRAGQGRAGRGGVRRSPEA